jgi:ABC-type nickel/cobalt efflux system permease component RcnA
MPVLRITSRFRVDAKPGVLTFEDPNYPQSNGWKEIVVDGDGVRRASQAAADRSRVLTAYPSESPSDAPQDVRARVEWSAAPSEHTRVLEPIAQPDATGKAEIPAGKPAPDSAQGKLARLIQEGNLGPLALFLAFVLGCAHAMTPGHGKTLVAAYLVGERGTAGQAVLLGLIVTVTHTLSVFALGLGMYFFAGKFALEPVTKLLEFVSGAAIAVLGLWLLYRRGLEFAGQSEGHTHTHDYGGNLWALGASGGIVPCPSALVLLLAAISLGRIGFGLILLVVFSMGLALVLIAAGMLVVSGKRFLPVERVLPVRYLPLVSAAVITVIGLALTLTALQVKLT